MIKKKNFSIINSIYLSFLSILPYSSLLRKEARIELEKILRSTFFLNRYKIKEIYAR